MNTIEFNAMIEETYQSTIGTLMESRIPTLDEWAEAIEALNTPKLRQIKRRIDVRPCDLIEEVVGVVARPSVRVYPSNVQRIEGPIDPYLRDGNGDIVRDAFGYACGR